MIKFTPFCIFVTDFFSQRNYLFQAKQLKRKSLFRNRGVSFFLHFDDPYRVDTK
jgi:hypothetical protein